MMMKRDRNTIETKNVDSKKQEKDGGDQRTDIMDANEWIATRSNQTTTLNKKNKRKKSTSMKENPNHKHNSKQKKQIHSKMWHYKTTSSSMQNVLSIDKVRRTWMIEGNKHKTTSKNKRLQTFDSMAGRSANLKLREKSEQIKTDDSPTFKLVSRSEKCRCCPLLLKTRFKNRFSFFGLMATSAVFSSPAPKDVDAAYELARKAYKELGVDTDEVIKQCLQIPISVHVWQAGTG